MVLDQFRIKIYKLQSSEKMSTIFLQNGILQISFAKDKVTIIFVGPSTRTTPDNLVIDKRPFPLILHLLKTKRIYFIYSYEIDLFELKQN